MEDIFRCKICLNNNNKTILDIGKIALSGRFLKENEKVEKYSLKLVSCSKCDLVQLNNSCDPELLYGDFYGYSSSLNKSMIDHLKEIYLSLSSFLKSDSQVLDIGSNDSTFLNFFKDQKIKIGIDPSAKKFNKNYINSELILDFFNNISAELINKKFGKFDIISSIAMFYDVEDPISFARSVEKLLTPNGVWVLEQSYLPLMIENNAFDTICHEHLLYYKLQDIFNIFENIGMKVFNVSFNKTNGGSFRLMCCKENSIYKINDYVKKAFKEELNFFSKENIYENFNKRINTIKIELRKLILDLNKKGIEVYGIGASTKGNVLLQFFEIDNKMIKAIGEVNPIKFGKFTPITNIPIVDQKEILSLKNSYFLILPWHFEYFFNKSELFKDLNLIFPLPNVKVKNG